jgi:hypothetical protein
MKLSGLLNYGNFDACFKCNCYAKLLYEGEFDSALLTNELMVLYGSVGRRGNTLTKFYNSVLALIVFRKQTYSKHLSPFATCWSSSYSPSSLVISPPCHRVFRGGHLGTNCFNGELRRPT